MGFAAVMYGGLAVFTACAAQVKRQLLFDCLGGVVRRGVGVGLYDSGHMRWSAGVGASCQVVYS